MEDVRRQHLTPHVRSLRQSLVVAAVLFAAVSRAAAQTSDGGPDPTKVRVRLGPLWLNPTIALTNLGVDNNVFNDPTDPRKDVTATVTPQTDAWLRMGRTWVTGTVKEDIVWFQKYASERSGNDSYTVGWRVPLNRLVASVNATWLDTRERPGYEIDTRAQNRVTTYSGSVELRTFSKTFIGVRGSQQTVRFDQNAVFRATNLHDELNRRSTIGGLTLRYQLTPLTNLTFAASRQQDRFDASLLRDSDSTTFSGSMAFEPAALIKGTATFGYEQFEPLSPGLPRFKGTTMAVDLSYTLLGVSRFAVQATRSVQYSFEIAQPYYVQTGVNGSVAQQIFGPVDVVARAATQRLDYRDREAIVVAVPNRLDNVRSYGGGVGYHFGRDLRFGVNIDKQRRTSALAFRQYDDVTFGTSFTYGF